MQQRRGLLGERVGDRGVAVAERRDREPGEEVEVALAVVVPQLGALAAHERHRRPVRTWASTVELMANRRSTAHGSDHRADAFVGEELEQQHVGEAAVEDVRAADAVAHRVHARRRPSGSSRRSSVPSAMSASSSSAVDLADQRRRIVDVAAKASTSVRYTSFSAPSASAIAPATVSALML